MDSRQRIILGVVTFRATRTVCVLLVIPTTTDPCLTASEAYSTWKMRPWGELQIVSIAAAVSGRTGRTKSRHRCHNCS